MNTAQLGGICFTKPHEILRELLMYDALWSPDLLSEGNPRKFEPLKDQFL